MKFGEILRQRLSDVRVNQQTEQKILQLLEALVIEVAAGRNDIRGIDVKVTGIEVKVTGLEVKFDRLDRRLGRVETRVEGVETQLRLFRHEFERRISPLER